jgi:hypothetical protein
VSAESSAFDLLKVPLIGRLFRWRHARTFLQIPMLDRGDCHDRPRIVRPHAGAQEPCDYPELGAFSRRSGAGAAMRRQSVLPGLSVHAGPPVGAALFRPRFIWPRKLRNKWLSAALFALILFVYELFDLWSSPWWTAWLIVAYFAAILVIDGFFKHAVFCKFVCPIGQFNFVASTLSPLEVKVRDQVFAFRASRRTASAAGATLRSGGHSTRLRISPVPARQVRQHGLYFLSGMRPSLSAR